MIATREHPRAARRLRWLEKLGSPGWCLDLDAVRFGPAPLPWELIAHGSWPRFVWELLRRLAWLARPSVEWHWGEPYHEGMYYWISVGTRLYFGRWTHELHGPRWLELGFSWTPWCWCLTIGPREWTHRDPGAWPP